MTEDKKKPEQDPAEGSRKTIEKELARQRNDAAIEKSRERLAQQVEEETDLPQKGAP